MHSTLIDKLKPGTWREHINIKAMSLEDALDLLGDVKEMSKFYKQLEGFMKEIVSSKMPEGETEYIGTHYAVILNERVRMGGLNKELILEEMGEAWVEEHSKEPTEYTEMRVTPVPEDE